MTAAGFLLAFAFLQVAHDISGVRFMHCMSGLFTAIAAHKFYEVCIEFIPMRIK